MKQTKDYDRQSWSILTDDVLRIVVSVERRVIILGRFVNLAWYMASRFNHSI